MMTTQQNDSSPASTTIGVGGPTSGEAGSTLTHETMAETGGSGGIQQTLPKDLEVAPVAPVAGQTEAAPDTASAAPEGAGTAATAAGRNYQDTRSSQAGHLPTGLGTPETGANQDERDLAPPRQ
jgi:hypothetical protein